MRVNSAVPDFLAFWETAAAESRAAQRQLWHELYEEPNRELFDLYYTNWASPDGLDAALDRFPAEVGTIAERAAWLPHRLTAAVRAAADFLEQPVPDLEVQLLVGLFRSDGWVTDFRGRPTLFLSAEYLPPYDAVFLAHECTHLVHAGAGFAGDTVAAALVAEGLAAAVSAELEPGHEEGVYLWMRDGREDWLAECIVRERIERTAACRSRFRRCRRIRELVPRQAQRIRASGPQRLFRRPAVGAGARRAIQRARVLELRAGARGAGLSGVT